MSNNFAASVASRLHVRLESGWSPPGVRTDLLLLERGAVGVDLEAEGLRRQVAELGVDEPDGPAALLVLPQLSVQLAVPVPVPVPVHAVAVPVHVGAATIKMHLLHTQTAYNKFQANFLSPIHERIISLRKKQFRTANWMKFSSHLFFIRQVTKNNIKHGI